jgi:hypothetical protein
MKMDLKENENEVVDWIHMVQDRDQWRILVGTVLNQRVP